MSDMTAAQLKAKLKALKWSQGILAKTLGLRPNTVSAWTTGKAPIPGYAVAYLTLATELKDIRDAANKRISPSVLRKI